MSKNQKLKQVIKEEADSDQNQLIVGEEASTKSRSAPVDINEYVKLRRVDTKRENCKKIEQIVKYAFQEALKSEFYVNLLKQKKNSVEDIFKMEQFRQQATKNIEIQLYAAALTTYVVVLGRKFSFEAKASRNSLMIFEIGKNKSTFQLMCYELAHIDLPSPTVWDEKYWVQVMENLRKAAKN